MFGLDNRYRRAKMGLAMPAGARYVSSNMTNAGTFIFW